MNEITEQERGNARRHYMIEFGEKVLEVVRLSTVWTDPVDLKAEEYWAAVSRFEMAETRLEKHDEFLRLEEKTQSLYAILAGEESHIVQNIGQDLDVVSHIYAALVMAKAQGRTEKEELARWREDGDMDGCDHVVDELKANGVWPWED